MIRVHPFAALRPPGSLAAEVASDPYDVVSTDEARQRAEGHPHAFLHVVRSEIDLPEGVDPYDPAVYETASRNLDAMVAERPETRSLVEKLELLLDDQEAIPSGEDIAAEIERFLSEAGDESAD